MSDPGQSAQGPQGSQGPHPFRTHLAAASEHAGQLAGLQPGPQPPLQPCRGHGSAWVEWQKAHAFAPAPSPSQPRAASCSLWGSAPKWGSPQLRA